MRRSVRLTILQQAPGPLLIYLALFLAALALRLFGISLQNIWYDEHWTLQVAAAPLADLPDLLPAAESSKPPLYFALMHFWMKWGTGEFWLRLPSAIFGALDCVVAAALGRQLFNPRLGAGLGWLLAISPFHIYYSQEGRPYALWSLLMTLALLFHVKFQAGPQKRFLIGYAGFSLLACYTFTYSLFIIPFSLLMAAAYRPALARESRAQLVWANGLIFLLYLPWLWKVVGAAIGGVGFQPLARNPIAAAAYALFSLPFGMSAGPSYEILRVAGFAVFLEDWLGGAALILGSLLLIGLATNGLRELWRTNRNVFFFAVFGLLLFWGTPALLSVINPEIAMNPRYVFAALIPILIMIAAVCSRALTRAWSPLLLATAFLLLLATSLAKHYFDPRYARDDLRGAAKFVAELEPPPEQIILCAGHLTDVFAYYFQKDIPVLPISLSASASIEQALEPIQKNLTQARHFALVYSRPDHGDPHRALPRILQAKHALIHHRHWPGVDVYLFETAQASASERFVPANLRANTGPAQF